MACGCGLPSCVVSPAARKRVRWINESKQPRHGPMDKDEVAAFFGYPEGRHFGPFRWRGHLNLKDITERVLSGSIAGLVAGGTFWALTRLVG